MSEDNQPNSYNVKQNEKRKGKKSFTAVRFDNDQEVLDEINDVIEMFGDTKKAAMVEAFKLLKKNLDRKASKAK